MLIIMVYLLEKFALLDYFYGSNESFRIASLRTVFPAP
jgi:hypothetical protein